MTWERMAEGHYTHKVVVWKASAATPPCALISQIWCSDDISPETCQGLTAREEVVDADFVEPEQLKALVAFHPHPTHDLPQSHGSGKWVKTHRPGRTRPRRCSLGCPGILGNRQAMEVAPCSFGLLWSEGMNGMNI